ncbi:hypothetical protein [Nitrosospira sp. NRS527]|uniref:hypothetical protein n=1 Tax=Nitrosospira sp. NRS527 TaxID=155925 RepID=UPI001AF0AFEF|nr:hypothetical protein [Nitrosospira sp. NRS527]BCT68329.1 hypothetical protein NNRS527_01926 [Nitrosospira sp. NRS527]
MKVRTLFYLVTLFLTVPMLSGCWLLAAAGVGAYGGYKANEEGYTLQNPIKKEKTENREGKN